MKHRVPSTLIGVLTSAVLVAAAQEPAPTFRAWIDVVTVDAFVHDGGRAITGLQARDFVVRDNGVEQVVESLGLTDSAHVIVGLDLSGSVDGESLARLRAGVRDLVGQLTPNDRVSLFTFADRVQLLWRAATPGGSLEAVLAQRQGAGGTTLQDALVFGSALTHADRRPSVFVLFTDGQDTASWNTATRALDMLRRTNVVVFPVGAGLPAVIPSPPGVDYFTHRTWLAPSGGDTLRLLQTVADTTGGEFLRVGRRTDLVPTFRGILERYRQRYLLTYAPSDAPVGGWHRLEVRLRTRAGTVVARDGYLARSTTSPPAK